MFGLQMGTVYSSMATVKQLCYYYVAKKCEAIKRVFVANVLINYTVDVMFTALKIIIAYVSRLNF